MRFSLRVFGLASVFSELSVLICSESRRALEFMVRELRYRMALRFALGGAAYGAAWAPRRRPDRLGRPVLTLSGRLRDSLSVEGHAEAVVEFGPMGVVFGTALPYASWLQFGTSRMVARPIFTPEIVSGLFPGSASG